MKLKLVTAILSGLFIIAAGSLLVLQNDKNQEALTKKYFETQLQNAVDQTASSISMMISGDMDKLRLIAGFLSEEGKDSWKKGKLKETLNKLAPDLQFTAVNVCDKDGWAIDLWDKTQTVSFCPYYQRALLGDTTVSITKLYEEDLEPSLVYTMPITQGKEITGVIRMAFDPETIRKQMIQSVFRGKEESYLLKRDSSILITVDHYVSPEGNFLEKLAAEEDTLKNIDQVIRQGRSITAEAYINNEKNYICFKGIKESNDWGIVITIPAKQLEILFKAENSSTQNIYNFVILFIMILLVCFLAVFCIKEVAGKQRMEYLAFYDRNTGSINYNRFKIDAAALLHKSSGANYALVLSAIDRYDYIRELLGAQECRSLLKSISKKLAALLNEDEIYCCYNSTSFALLLKYHNKEELTDRIGYINAKLCSFNDTEIKNDKFELRMHFGIYCVREGENDIDLFVDRAGQALNLIKGDRRQIIEYYSNEMKNRIINETEIEERMFTALEEKEFLVYLQPKFDLNTGYQVGAEALVRWMHPEKGMIYPGHFLGVFEKNGFIVRMDMYMLDIMCHWLKIWMSKGYRPLPLSLNISRLNLFDENFVSNMISTLERYGVPPNLINLEISEEVVTDNIEILTALMARLKKYGFLISMDDFGAGTASMNTLYHVPVDELKLERKFLLGAEKTDRGKKVIGSIIEMAKRLNIKVVSEGVENKAQAKMLKELGCDMIQGFVFSEPLPIKEYEKFTYGPGAKENKIW